MHQESMIRRLCEGCNYYVYTILPQIKGGSGSVVSISRVYEEILHIYKHEGFLQLWTPGQ